MTTGFFFCIMTKGDVKMNQDIMDSLRSTIEDFALPRYEQIPDIGLYLEQITKYISEYAEALGQPPLTGSMVSNYVKKGIIKSPVKKQYDRDQIAHLMFITLAKSILSLDDLQKYILLQQQTYAVSVAYDYFCRELEAALHVVFDPSSQETRISPASSAEKTILRNIVITIAHKIYLEKYISAVTEAHGRDTQ